MGKITPRAWAWLTAAIAAWLTAFLLGGLLIGLPAIVLGWGAASVSAFELAFLTPSFPLVVLSRPLDAMYDKLPLSDVASLWLWPVGYILVLLLCALPGAYLVAAWNDNSEAMVAISLHVILCVILVLGVYAFVITLGWQSVRASMTDGMTAVAYFIAALFGAGIQLLAASFAIIADIGLVRYLLKRTHPQQKTKTNA